MKRLPLFTVLFLIYLSIMPVSLAAVDVSFSDLQLIKGMNILVYNVSGSAKPQLVTEINTTQSLSLNESENYIFVIKPSDQSYFTDPIKSIELLKAYMPVIITYLLYAVVIIGSGFMLVKLWR